MAVRHQAGNAFAVAHGTQASPAKEGCAERMRIKWDTLSCLDTLDLGNVARNNVNYIY